MDTFLLILYLGALVLITFWLVVYVWGLYCFGRYIAVNRRTRPTKTVAGIVIASTALAAGCAFIPLDMYIKATIMFAVWILHAWPTFIGFSEGMEIGREKDLDRWKQRTEEWLSEWEDPVPKWLRDELDN